MKTLNKIIIAALALMASHEAIKADVIYETYNLWICGTQVTGENCADLSVIDGVTGSAWYDGANKTLVLNGATISQTHSGGYAITSQIDGLTIKTLAASSVSCSNDYTIYLQATTTFTGGAVTLSVSGKSAVVINKDSLIVSGDMTLSCEGTNYGIDGKYQYDPMPKTYLKVASPSAKIKSKGVNGSVVNFTNFVIDHSVVGIVTPTDGVYENYFSHYSVGRWNQDYTNSIVKDEWVTIGLKVRIDGEHFPDENFRNYILAQPYGTDEYLTCEDVPSIMSLIINNKNISDLTGIGYFSNLTYLNCSFNNLTTLDLSHNAMLNNVYCQVNNIAGSGVEEMIVNLPVVDNKTIYLYKPDATSENNLFTRPFVQLAKRLGWVVKRYSTESSSWIDYDGEASDMSELEDDMNCDGKISIADVTKQVNIITNQ